MRSPQAAPEAGKPAQDTRGRILDAAVERFGRDGFGASLRAIATDAEVSAAAIIKHFGSKEQLHQACDQHVLTVISAYKTEAMRSTDLRSTFLAQMALLDEFQPLVRYLIRSFLVAGDAARNLLEDTHTQAAQWMRDGVDAGHVRPSRNEELRVKLTISISIGWMVQSVLLADQDLGDLGPAFWEQTLNDMMLPTLEIYTDGLLTDGTLLDEYLQYRSRRSAPGDADRPDHHQQPG